MIGRRRRRMTGIIVIKNDQIRQNDLPKIFNVGVMASDTLYI